MPTNLESRLNNIVIVLSIDYLLRTMIDYLGLKMVCIQALRVGGWSQYDPSFESAFESAVGRYCAD
jgi:hypothetical protein